MWTGRNVYFKTITNILLMAFVVLSTTKLHGNRGQRFHYLCAEDHPMKHGPSLWSSAREWRMLPSWPRALIVTRKCLRLLTYTWKFKMLMEIKHYTVWLDFYSTRFVMTIKRPQNMWLMHVNSKYPLIYCSKTQQRLSVNLSTNHKTHALIKLNLPRFFEICTIFGLLP